MEHIYVITVFLYVSAVSQILVKPYKLTPILRMLAVEYIR